MLLLDKTGTITLGNRRATELLPLDGVTGEELAEAALLASLADETPEGRSIVELGRRRPRRPPAAPSLVEFSATTRMSGIDLAAARCARAPAVRRCTAWVGRTDARLDDLVRAGRARPAARRSSSPSADGGALLGVIHLKDVVKDGMRERFAELRAMGIRTVMVTGDNRGDRRGDRRRGRRRRRARRGHARGQAAP